MDRATTSTSAEELIDDRTERLRLFLGEAERRMQDNDSDAQLIRQAKQQTAHWHEACREEMAEVHRAARKRGHKRLQVLFEPLPGLEAAIGPMLQHATEQGQRRWISALWNTDVRGATRGESRATYPAPA